MKHIYLYILGAALAAAPESLWGQSVLSPSTAIAVGERGALKAMAHGNGDAVSAYVSIDPESTSWSELGLEPIAIAGNTATVRVPAASLQKLAGQKGVRYIQLTAGVSQMLDVARKEAGTDDIHKGVSLQQPFTGKDVVVGIVDAGFDYLHSAFRNPTDGSLRIKRVWEQKASTLSGAKAPEKFGYGIELNTPELIEAAQGDTDSNSHGTHVAAIAAGDDDYKDGAYVGNAPERTSCSWRSTSTTTRAQTSAMPCSMCSTMPTRWASRVSST